MKYKVTAGNSVTHFDLRSMVGYHAAPMHNNETGQEFIQCVVFLTGGTHVNVNFSNSRELEILVDAWLRATETRPSIVGVKVG